jgi:ankyrin repeat protein
MDTLPLPPRPNLEQYRKRVVAAASSADPQAVRVWANDWIETLVELLEVPTSPPFLELMDRAVGRLVDAVRERPKSGDRLTLADAQFFIARAHSFENWAEFAAHLDPSKRPADNDFEAAANAVVGGDLQTLQSLLRAHPDLVRARSARVHRATLLHYVSANGVEDWRQKTPPNAVAIARCLLEAGAEVDALAETYGGGIAQTTMNLLVSSTHPADAGLQSALADVLIDFGAAINGLDDEGSPIMTALMFGYGDAAEALARRGARIDNLVAAAAIGRLDVVQQLIDDVDPKPSLRKIYWINLPADLKSRRELALVEAAAYGRLEIVEYLLGRGVDPGSSNKDHMSALHTAAAHGQMQVIDLLLKHGAPLEVENVWGGTVLNSTLHFVFNSPYRGVDYPAVVQRLVTAGADTGVVDMPTGDARVDEAIRNGERLRAVSKNKSL